MAVVVGQAAPDFELAAAGAATPQVKLVDYRGHWVVMFFYPKDMTSG